MSPRLLALIAVAAQVLQQLFLLLPLAVFFGINALLFWNPVLAIIYLVAFLFLAWLMQPDARLAFKPLDREQAPKLYAEVDQLADAIQAPRVHAIVLDDDLNAGALEQNRGVSLRRTRRVLFLGRPLLECLDRDAVLAVVAHELGHFSHQHGRMGHWLYRTRQAWESWQLHAADEHSSSRDRLAGKFASAFVPWFQRVSHAHSRQCEFEADAVAARACGAQVVARALTLVERAALAQKRGDTAALLKLRRLHAEPPADLLSQRVAAWRQTAPGDISATADEEATHPPSAQRMAALGAEPDKWPWPMESAYRAWLAEGDAAMGRHDRIIWTLWHELLSRLDAERRGYAESDLRLVAALGDYAEVLRLTEVLPPAPETDLLRARASFACGQLAQARVLWMACAETTQPRRGEREVAYDALARHGLVLGLDSPERVEYQRRAQVAARRNTAADAKLLKALEHGKVQPASDWPEGWREALGAALMRHPALHEAWLCAAEIEMPNEWSYGGLVLWIRIDPKAMSELSLNADQIGDACLDLLQRCAPLGTICALRSSYTTEGLPPEFERVNAALRIA